MKKRNYNGARRETAVFVSAGRGTGATFAAIACANFFASVKMRSVCVVELSGRNELAFTANDAAVIHNTAAGFTYCGADYFPEASERELLDILEMPYDLVVIDGGAAGTALPNVHIDSLYIAASTAPWRRAELYDLFDRTFITEDNGLQDGKILLTAPVEKNRLALARTLRMQVLAMPWIGDPYRLSREDCLALAQVFGAGSSEKRRTFGLFR